MSLNDELDTLLLRTLRGKLYGICVSCSHHRESNSRCAASGNGVARGRQISRFFTPGFE